MLKLAKGTIEVKFTLDEANEYNAMVKRNEAKAVVKREESFESNGKDIEYVNLYCPVCNEFIWNKDTKKKFCPYCGQRIDTENYALIDKK